MFHAFDKPEATSEGAARAEWMRVLARAPLSLLEPAVAACEPPAAQWLRAPETGLMMVQGRVGGTGERFNLGEVTVTRCALRLGGGGAAPRVGIAYVMGRSHRHAQLAATADALLQDPERRPALATRLLQPIREHLARDAAARRARAQASRVEFFTVAREAGAGNDQEDDA